MMRNRPATRSGPIRERKRGVEARDDLVINGYVGPTGKSNDHKSDGYLRAPEVSAAIRAFL